MKDFHNFTFYWIFKSFYFIVEEAHPGPAIAALMKLSFDEEHRLAMCQLGALYVIARLIQV